MATKRVLTKAKREQAEAIVRGSAGEPGVTQSNYRVDLMVAVNWYNQNEDP